MSAKVYGAEYFAKYQGYAETEMGKQLTEARVHLIKKHLSPDDTLIDIGIGCGQFLEAAPTTLCYGIDVNLKAIEWLRHSGKEWPCKELPNATFWDSLEHIADAPRMIERVRGHAFVSMPIYEGIDHVLKSRHYRPDEHYWYFTDDGLVRMFDLLGFDLEERSMMETELGREDIGTYVFRRR